MTKMTILVAVGQLVAAKAPKVGEAPEPIIIKDGTEITKQLFKEIGISADDLEALMAGGKIIEVPVRSSKDDADSGDSAALVAAEADAANANKRAKDAEDALATANARIAELEKSADTAKAKA